MQRPEDGVILCFNLECPLGHPVVGAPHEYAGTENPPDAWMDNLSRLFVRDLKYCPPETTRCGACGAQWTPDVDNWLISVQPMKATSMAAAIQDLKTCAITIQVPEDDPLPRCCMACGAPLMGGATKHRRGCEIARLIDEFFPGTSPKS